MINICFVCYYELKQALLEAAKSLEKLNYKIYDFPMHKYIHDHYDKIDNYDKLFIDFIFENKIDVILWWFIKINTDKFEYIHNVTKTKYIFFNWDEPCNWEDCDIKNKAKFFDCAFITCKETLQKYIEHGCKDVYCLLPGFSPDVNYPLIDFEYDKYVKYGCDISFCFTNLYENPNFNTQYIQRKKLLDDIYNNQKIRNYTLHIYCPEHIGINYPESYKGTIDYYDLNYLFNYSKINLCTHVINADGYINERTILIGGSGGLILVDNVKGIEEYFDTQNEIIILEKDRYIDQIVEILNNYDNMRTIKNNFHEKCIKKYTYDSWAKNIDDKYLKKI